jgi:hypothetical protein
MAKACHAALGSVKGMGGATAMAGTLFNMKLSVTRSQASVDFSVISASGTIRVYDRQDGDVDTRQAEYEEQKEAFEIIPVATLNRYAGLWVIARNGEIVASDSDLNKMTAQYFRRAGDIAVYITRIGGESEDYIGSPIEED